jgi:hypothetical protein
MINRYVVYSQYEYMGNDKKETTNWFVVGRYHKTEDEAKEAVKQLKELSDVTDKITKLKHFYDIRLQDITQFPIPTYHFKTKGRPTKDELRKRDEYYAHYWERFA